MTAINYTASQISFSTDDLVTTVYTYQAFPLGLRREEDGNTFRFVKYDNGTANINTVDGQLVYSLAPGTSLWTVVTDVSDTHRNQVVGVARSVMTDQTYGWVQTWGYHATVATNGDDDIAAGDAVIASSAGDGTADSTAAGTAPVAKVVGFATAADSDANNTVACLICLSR